MLSLQKRKFYIYEILILFLGLESTYITETEAPKTPKTPNSKRRKYSRSRSISKSTQTPPRKNSISTQTPPRKNSVLTPYGSKRHNIDFIKRINE